MRIGTDLIRIERICRARKRFGSRFVDRLLLEGEWDPKRGCESLAGLWALKEATAKALGCGIGSELSFHDIRIVKSPKGAPSLELSPDALRRFPLKDASVSVSHDGGFAVAVVALTLANPSAPSDEVE